MAKFKKAYGKSVKPMTDRKQWPKVDPGFKLWPPILKGQLVDQGKEGTNQLQKVALQRDPQDAKGVNSLGTWKKLAMNMFMNLMHHRLPLQNQREREARKMSQ